NRPAGSTGTRVSPRSACVKATIRKACRPWCCGATSADESAQTRYDVRTARSSQDSRFQEGSKSKPIGMKGSRKLYIKSFGCQMNVYDSQRMADTLAPEGYVETTTPEDADLVILNTCHIREKAAEKLYSELGRVRRLKEAAAGDGRNVMIAVAGCVAQAE